MQNESLPLVSIVMLAWNRKDEVDKSLKHVFKSTYRNLEVIVVDNGSTDNTAEMIEERYPQVKLIRMPQNEGIYGYNVGFANAKGRYVVVLDDDSYPAQDSIHKMVTKFEEDEKIGVVGFNIKNTHTNSFETGARFGESDQVEDIYFLGGGAGIRKECLNKIGYYEKKLFLYLNELEFSIRCWEAGFKVVLYKDIIAYHTASPQNRESWRRFYFVYRNLFYVFIKYFPFPQDYFKILGNLIKATYSGIRNGHFKYLMKLYINIFGLLVMKRNKITSPKTLQILNTRWNINAH